jgi:hypothetical protein
MAAGLTLFLECDGIAIFPETEDVWLDDMLIYLREPIHAIVDKVFAV